MKNNNGDETIMDIEGIAVSKVINEILKYECLKEYINKNDKTPMWDGEIYIYKENSKYKSNEDFIGKIGVQIKGHKVSKIKVGNSKYSIDVEYLKAYKKEKKGVLLFVVEIIDCENTQIYYRNLLPVDLKEILERVEEGQKTITIDIRPIKEKSSSSMKMICQNFLENSNKQMNIEIKNIDELKNIDEISFSIIGDNQYIEEYMFNNDVYTYAIDKISNQKIALQKLTKIESFRTVKLGVKIKDKEYYKKITFLKNKDEEYILIGKATKIYLKINKVKFHICGNIYERINDIHFIIDLLKNNELYIDSIRLPMKDIMEKNAKEEYIKSLEKDLKGLMIIKKIFKKYQIKFDIDLEKLDKKSWDNLERFIKLNNGIMIEGLNKSNIYFIDIDKYSIAFIVLYDSNNEINVYNYFEDLSDKIKVFYFDKDKNPISVSPYINLTAQNLVKFSNVNIEVIKETFEKEKYSEETCEKYNLWLLELIKAYDISKDRRWLDFAEYLNNRIIISCKNPTYVVNKMQILKRSRELNVKEKDELYIIRDKEKDNMMKCAIAILLENWSDFERYMNKLTEEEKKQFEEFPIYNLKNNKN